MRSTWLPALILACGLGAAGTASAESDFPDASGMTYEEKLQACAACHGENGDKPLAPDYPILAGQYEDYLVAALTAYRTGRRKHPIMNMQVEQLGLTRKDIERLARHFSHEKGLTSLGE
jgi:cytochrome c553